MELNREQVIAELLKNDSCYAEDIKAIQNAIALINEFAEQIKDLTETVTVSGKVIEQLQILTSEIEEDNRKLIEENERLRAENKIEYETPCGKQTMPNLLHLEGAAASLYTQIENKIKSVTVREVCEMFKGIVEFDIALTEAETEYLCDRIDQIANEFMEGI